MLRNRSLISLLVLAALLLTAACQPITAQSQPMTPPTDEQVVAAVNAIWDEYEASVIAGDVDRWIAQWTDDGVQMPPNEPFVEGKENIYARVAAVMAAGPTSTFEISALETTSAGDWAYSRGVYKVTFPLGDSGEEGMIDGKFMTILQRQPDGTWKIHRDIYNSNVLPAAPAAAEETDVEAVTESILATWDEYVASTLTNDVDRRLALWADDGVILRPGQPPVVGKDAIYERVNSSFSKMTNEAMTIDNIEVEVSGDLAFARGTYTVKAVANATGESSFTDGTYMSIFKRQADGTWKLYRDMTHSNVPPAAPPDPDIAAVTAEIDALFTEYGDSLAADDAERWVQLWVEDGVQLPPGAPPNVGRDAIFASISSAMEHYGYRDMAIQVDEVLLAGDLAIARGMYTVMLVPRDGSAQILVDGKYTTTFQRQADGSWKIYRDIFNSNE